MDGQLSTFLPQPSTVAATEPHGSQVALPWTVSAGLLLSAIDYGGWINSGPAYRYGVVLTVLLMGLYADTRANRPLPYRNRISVTAVAAVMFSAWLLALVWVALLKGQWLPETAVVVALPLFIGIYGLSQLMSEQQHSGSPSGNRVIGWFAGIFTLLALYDAIQSSPGEPLAFLSHERSYIVVFILCLPKLRGIIVIRILAATSLVISLVKYPSATTIIAVLAAAVAYWVVNSGRRRLRGITVLAAIIVGAQIGGHRVQEVLDHLYLQVGRSNNSSTRAILWEQGFPILKQNPFVGGATTEAVTGIANINGRLQYVPLHNSFLTLGVVGGGIAVLLFILLLLSAMVPALRASEMIPEDREASIWLPALVSVLVSMTVNPIIDRLGCAIFLYILIALGMEAAASNRNKADVLAQRLMKESDFVKSGPE